MYLGSWVQRLASWRGGLLTLNTCLWKRLYFLVACNRKGQRLQYLRLELYDKDREETVNECSVRSVFRVGTQEIEGFVCIGVGDSRHCIALKV